jgi:hypothetical protein
MYELLHPYTENQEVPLITLKKPNASRNKVTFAGKLEYLLIKHMETQQVSITPTEVMKYPDTDEIILTPNITVIRSPEEERKRQHLENISLPGLLEASIRQTEEILLHPFEASSLISEIHFGQLVSSYRKNQHTILRSGNSELFCVPTTHAGFTELGAHIIKKNKVSRAIEPEAPAIEELLYLVGKYEKSQLSKRDMQYLIRVKDVMMKCLGVVNLRKHRALMRSTAISLYGDYKDNNGADVVKRGISEFSKAFECPVEIYLLEPNGKTFINSSQIERQIGSVNSDFDTLIQAFAKLARYGVYFQVYRGHIDVFGDDWKALTMTQCHLKPLLSSKPLLSRPVDGDNKMNDFTGDSSLSILEAFESEGIIQLISKLASSCISNGMYICPMFAHKEVLMGMMVVQDIDNIPYALYNRNNVLGREKDIGSGSELPGSGLSGFGLSGSRLSGSELPGSGLPGSGLSTGSGLSGSRLSESKLPGSGLSGSRLSGNNLDVNRQTSRDIESTLPINPSILRDSTKDSEVQGPEDGVLQSIRQSALVLSSSLLSARCCELIGTYPHIYINIYIYIYIYI